MLTSTSSTRSSLRVSQVLLMFRVFVADKGHYIFFNAPFKNIFKLLFESRSGF